MMRSVLGLGLATALTVTLTAIVTWPQVVDPANTIVAHHDAYFSIWRIGWIAHALATSPTQLFDGNIFYPAKGTLAYSDATLLEGLVASPMLWAGMSPTLVYNILLGIGYAGSGVAMFVLARSLTGHLGAGLIAAAGFTLAPYRTEHMMHLELQWAMWIPLTLWAVHRTIAVPSWRWGALAGGFFAMQVLSCVYYGVFLALLLCVLVPLLLAVSGFRLARAALMPLAAAAIVAAVLVLPYAWPYLQASQELGARDMREVLQYSAQPINYLSSPPVSRLWGWTADRWGGSETRLFPGLLLVLLALASLLHRSLRLIAAYALGAAIAVVLSFGVNSAPYRWIFEHLTLLQGLRSSSRFAIIVVAMLSVLAAFGAQAILERTRWRFSSALALLSLMTLESINHPIGLSAEQLTIPASVYKVVRSAGPGVVVELPLPNVNALPGWDPYYSVWSLQHWHPLVNGYSGYYPPDYVRSMVRMGSFPDEASIARLRAHHVRYVIVHKAFFAPERYTALLLDLANRPEFKPYGTYKDAIDDAVLFVMEQ